MSFYGYCTVISRKEGKYDTTDQKETILGSVSTGNKEHKSGLMAKDAALRMVVEALDT